MREKRQWTKQEMVYFLMLMNRYCFLLLFWHDELRITADRDDLPPEWVGQVVISKEQRLMLLDNAQKIQFCTARKIAKTLILEVYYYHYPLMNLIDGKARDGLFHAPRESQRDPVMGRIEEKANRTPFFSLLRLSFNKGEQVFKFRGGFTWFNRIEGNPATAGRNMVGLRASVMLGDEGAYGNDAAFSERLNTALPNAREIWAGVPNGIRGTKFHRISSTSEGAGWSLHNYNILASPLYHSLKAWRKLVEDHGGTNTQSFITQVLGLWGEATVASFAIIPHTSMHPFTLCELTGESINANLEALAFLVDIKLPARHEGFIMGGDLGYSPSPTVLCVMFQADGMWWELAKVSMLTANSIYQARVIDAICTRVLPQRPLMGCLDAHGRGAGVLDALQHMPEFDNVYYRERFVDAGFAGTSPDERIPVHKVCQQRVRQADDGSYYCDSCMTVIGRKDVRPAMIPTKQHLTVKMKEMFMYGQQHLDDWYASGHTPPAAGDE